MCEDKKDALINASFLFLLNSEAIRKICRLFCCHGYSVCNAVPTIIKQAAGNLAVNSCVNAQRFLCDAAFFGFLVVFARCIAFAMRLSFNGYVFCRASAVFVEGAAFAFAF